MLYYLLFLSYISYSLGKFSAKFSIKRLQDHFHNWNKNDTGYHGIFKKIFVIPYELEPYEIDMFLN